MKNLDIFDKRVGKQHIGKKFLYAVVLFPNDDALIAELQSKHSVFRLSTGKLKKHRSPTLGNVECFEFYIVIVVHVLFFRESKKVEKKGEV